MRGMEVDDGEWLYTEDAQQGGGGGGGGGGETVSRSNLLLRFFHSRYFY